MEVNKIYNMDCLEGMKQIPDKSIDVILCDLPYGTTQNKWDAIIPFEALWQSYCRIIKDNGAIVLTGQDKFTARLMLSNEKMHRYNLIWEKTDRPTGFLNCNRMPLRSHEDIVIFYKSLPTYNPQMEIGKENHSRGHSRGKKTNNCYGDFNQDHKEVFTNEKFPRSILKFSREHPPVHPTQKPVALFEYLIKTYTNKGDIVLDNCIGSGTTAVACINTGRNFIGFELDEKYYQIALDRIAVAMKQRDTPQQTTLSEATTSGKPDPTGNITRGYQATEVAQIAEATSESPIPVIHNSGFPRWSSP